MKATIREMAETIASQALKHISTAFNEADEQLKQKTLGELFSDEEMKTIHFDAVTLQQVFNKYDDQLVRLIKAVNEIINGGGTDAN